MFKRTATQYTNLKSVFFIVLLFLCRLLMSYQIVLFFVSDKMVPFPLSVTASHMLMLWLAGSAAPACSAQWQENADAVPKQTNKTWMVGSMAISDLTQSN